jgi:ATP-dependent RNA helicase DeaD
MPHDWASIAHFLAPLLDRVEPSLPGIQLLVVTPDAESAAAVGAAAVRLIGERGIEVVAATAVNRAARLLRMRPVHVLTGPPDTLVELVRAAAIKLDGVRAATIAWADELLARGGGAALETLMAELPKDGARVVVTGVLTTDVEGLIERYARRARRVTSAMSESDPPTAIEYVSVGAHARLTALRRVLDELDPGSALVFVRSDTSETSVGELLRSLGYSRTDSPVRAGRVAEPGTDVVILYDLPASREELRETLGAEARRVVALAQPRQLESLRVLAAQGAVKPLTLLGATDRARDREAAMRTELRDVLATGTFGRELLALEPLLEEYDGIEIAAAALRLLDQARSARPIAAPEPRPTASASASASGMVRLFVNVGSRDNVRPGDLVGAMTTQAGITSADIGKIDVRESHSLVDVAPTVAATVVDKLTGTTIRGRRAVARLDTERPPRDAGRGPEGRGSGSRGPGSRGPGDRGAGGRGAGGRGAPDRASDRFRRPAGDKSPRSGTRRRDPE